MAKGRQKHEARLADIAAHGKDIARRAGRKCELCEGAEDLRTYDTTPDDEPSMDTLVLLCDRCRGLADGSPADPRTLRFLETAVWSEVAPAARLARTLIESVDADWARDTVDMLP